MSEDELPMVGGAGLPDDDDEGDIGGDSTPPKDLPEGVAKEVVTAAPDSEWKKPKSGDEVSVHYVGTLQSDGSQFDSSRDRGQPFKFTLGKGEVIKGWDMGVATMKRGEVAKFTLAPEFAYGDAGSPPKIPEKATLVFEVELLGWVSKDDLFGDEGAIKSQLKEGSGWKKPKDHDEVKLTLKALAADGSVIEERQDIEYQLGSGVFGPLSQVVDKALASMKKGEEVSLKCTKDYMYGDERPDGGSVELALHELYETKDISLSKDKSLMKKQVKEGEEWDTPKDTSKVTLFVEAVTDGEKPIPGFESKELEFTAGNGEVSDGLELVVLDMKKGERAVLTCTKPALVAEEKLGLKDLSGAEKVLLTLELRGFEKAKDTWNMSEDEKLEFGLARKEVGSNLFKLGRAELALERYKKVSELFNHVDNFKEDNKAKAKELKKVCELNKAACLLKLKQHQEAKVACNAVLKEESSSVKALFRRAQADFGLHEFDSCMRDLKRVLELDAQNREARALLKQASACQREEDLKVRGMFAKMCKGIAAPSRKNDAEQAEQPEATAGAGKAGQTEQAEQANQADQADEGKDVAAADSGVAATEAVEAVPAEA